MRLIALGSSPAFPNKGEACSGYSVRAAAPEERRELLLDCGTGVFSAWREAGFSPADLGGVLITHLHADHFFDLVPLAYALKLWPAELGGVSGEARPTLWLPQGGAGELRKLCGIWGDPLLCERAFQILEYSPGDLILAEGLELKTAAVPHFVPTVAVALREAATVAPGPAEIVYGSDCGFNEALIRLASGAEHLLCEATLPEPASESDLAGHMTALQAGELGARAGVRNLWLTHYSDFCSSAELVQRAERGAVRLVGAARPLIRAVYPGERLGERLQG